MKDTLDQECFVSTARRIRWINDSALELWR